VRVGNGQEQGTLKEVVAPVDDREQADLEHVDHRTGIRLESDREHGVHLDGVDVESQAVVRRSPRHDRVGVRRALGDDTVEQTGDHVLVTILHARGMHDPPDVRAEGDLLVDVRNVEVRGGPELFARLAAVGPERVRLGPVDEFEH
jgi:hypothetical protein